MILKSFEYFFGFFGENLEILIDKFFQRFIMKHHGEVDFLSVISPKQNNPPSPLGSGEVRPTR